MTDARRIMTDSYEPRDGCESRLVHARGTRATVKKSGHLTLTYSVCHVIEAFRRLLTRLLLMARGLAGDV